MTGKKFDESKAPIALLPGMSLVKIAYVMGFGAEKYGVHNWRGGITYTRMLGAILRHVLAFQEGQDDDIESGMPHLAHAGAGILMLLEFMARPDLDDRYKQPDPPSQTDDFLDAIYNFGARNV